MAGCTFGGVLVPDSRDLTQQAIAGDTFNRGETLNLTWQISPRNKATIFSHFNQRLVDCNGCSATTSPEASTYFTHTFPRSVAAACRRRALRVRSPA